MKEKPILSVIIPTKNNEFYAEKSIRTIFKHKDKSMEIVLQDNGKNSKLHIALNDLIENGSIVYNHTVEDLTVVENFSRGIAISTGEYICMIGDDDCVHPDITKVVEWARDNQIESLVPKLKAVYYWPGVAFRKNKNGCLSLSNFSGEISLHKPQEQLVKLLQNGCLDYLDHHLPKVYHGIVLRKKMDEIRDITGNYFSALVPDMYGVIALSLILDEVIYIDFPLTISGISPKSNSGKSVKNETNGPLENAPHLKGRKSYDWSENVPRIFSGETIWADTLMHALDDMNRSELKAYFRPEKLHERLWFRYGNLRGELEAHYGGKPKKNRNIIKILFNSLKDIAKGIPIIVSLYMRYKGIVIERNVKDMESAISLLLCDKYSSVNLKSNAKI